MPSRPAGSSSPISTRVCASGASRMASRAAPANSAEATTTRARVSRSSSPSSVPLYMVDTGTAIAPSRSSARKVTTCSGQSVAAISTRSSGRIPSEASPAAKTATCPASSA